MIKLIYKTQHIIRSTRLTVALCSLSLSLIGCASKTENRPTWLVNPQEVYPDAGYLTAIGEGDTRRAAENNAAAGLARIFESRVHAKETLSETTTEQSGTIESIDQFSELQSNVQINSDQKLFNIQFGESYTSPSGRIHVSAIIPRNETAAIYRERIAMNSSSITQLISRSNEADNTINAYAFRRAAVRHALTNDQLLAQLDIIHPGSHNQVLLNYNPQTLYSETADAARNITFAVDFHGPGGDALRETLTGMGFSEKTEYPALTFSGNASFEKVNLRRGALVFVRFRYTLKTRTRDENLILALNGSRREGHISFEEATARAERSLCRKIHIDVSRELSRLFDRRASAD